MRYCHSIYFGESFSIFEQNLKEKSPKGILKPVYYACIGFYFLPENRLFALINKGYCKLWRIEDGRETELLYEGVNRCEDNICFARTGSDIYFVSNMHELVRVSTESLTETVMASKLDKFALYKPETNQFDPIILFSNGLITFQGRQWQLEMRDELIYCWNCIHILGNSIALIMGSGWSSKGQKTYNVYHLMDLRTTKGIRQSQEFEAMHIEVIESSKPCF